MNKRNSFQKTIDRGSLKRKTRKNHKKTAHFKKTAKKLYGHLNRNHAGEKHERSPDEH